MPEQNLEADRQRTEWLLARKVQDLETLAIHRILAFIQRQQANAQNAMQEGHYGICVRCDKPIEPARIEAVRYATLCVDCAQAENLSKCSRCVPQNKR